MLRVQGAALRPVDQYDAVLDRHDTQRFRRSRHRGHARASFRRRSSPGRLPFSIARLDRHRLARPAARRRSFSRSMSAARDRIVGVPAPPDRPPPPRSTPRTTRAAPPPAAWGARSSATPVIAAAIARNTKKMPGAASSAIPSATAAISHAPAGPPISWRVMGGAASRRSPTPAKAGASVGKVVRNADAARRHDPSRTWPPASAGERVILAVRIEHFLRAYCCGNSNGPVRVRRQRSARPSASAPSTCGGFADSASFASSPIPPRRPHQLRRLDREQDRLRVRADVANLPIASTYFCAMK